MTSASSSPGELRQLTVMFSDVVGSAELSGQFDPEDWHDIVSRYHTAASEVVGRFDGSVAQYLGDGILILFGYPRAHENDAERAVLTGLAILEQMNWLNDSLEAEYGKRLAVRIGVDTGEVMVRESEGDSGNIFGETPNIAARVQSSAAPDTVCISASTQRLVAGFFVVEDLGPHVLKGLPNPIELYKVERATGVRSRLHATSDTSLTPFVGREEERNLLMNRWTQAQKGKGQLIVIKGEAGIGKSRLLRQFKEDLGGIPHTWVEGESSPYEQDTPFAPTLDLVENAFQWTLDTTSEVRIADLEGSFSQVGIDPAKGVPLMALLFGFSVPADQYPPLLLSPEQLRTELLQTLVDWALGNARLQPTVLLMEDLHFADPSTMEELIMLSEQMENAPLLLVFTARSGFDSPWPTQPFHSLIELDRLGPETIREMIEPLLGERVQRSTLETLIARTDGVPLFAEELSFAIAESSEGAPMDGHLPATVQELLMARLDSLGPYKDVAQVGALIGREFSHSLLTAIANLPEAELTAALDGLEESGMVIADISSSEKIYTFKHALVQEAAYNALLKKRRRELHSSAARAIRTEFPGVAKQRPELVAHHLTEAGEVEKAIEAWQEAGEFSTGRAALKEASTHYHKALEILVTLPDTDDRAQMELPLQIGLGSVFQAIVGFGSQEAADAFTRARVLAGQLEESPQLFFILLGLWSTTNTRSELKASKEIADQMLRIAERERDPMLLVWANLTQAIEAYAVGRFTEVEAYVDQVSSNYKADDHTWSPFDPLVTVRGHACYALWHLGFVDQALRRSREHLDSTATLSPANVAMGHLTTCDLSMYLQDDDSLIASAGAILEIGEDRKLPSFLAWGAMYMGIGLILRGQNEEGIAMLSKGIGRYLDAGTHSSLGLYLSRLAIGHGQNGDIDLALKTIADAFGASPYEKMHLPDLHRIRADLLWLRGEPGDLEAAEQDYRQSVEISEQFESLSQKLRASTRLGRLLQSQGRGAEAQTLLAPVYAKFTEGFDTADLVEARALLDELAAELPTESE